MTAITKRGGASWILIDRRRAGYDSPAYPAPTEATR